MKLVVFTGSSTQAGHRLVRLVKTIAPEKPVEVFGTIDTLSNMLRRFHSEPLLIIILAASQDDLMNILLLKEQLSDIPIVLILPDRQPATISAGTKLHPRFISYSDSDFVDIREVLEKMIEKLT